MVKVVLVKSALSPPNINQLKTTVKIRKMDSFLALLEIELKRKLLVELNQIKWVCSQAQISDPDRLVLNAKEPNQALMTTILQNIVHSNHQSKHSQVSSSGGTPSNLNKTSTLSQPKSTQRINDQTDLPNLEIPHSTSSFQKNAINQCSSSDPDPSISNPVLPPPPPHLNLKLEQVIQNLSSYLYLFDSIHETNLKNLNLELSRKIQVLEQMTGELELYKNEIKGFI